MENLIVLEEKRIGIIGDEEFLTNLKQAVEAALVNGVEKFKTGDKTVIVKLEKEHSKVKLAELEELLDRWTAIRDFLLSLVSYMGEKCLEEKERGKHECYGKMLNLLRKVDSILFQDRKRVRMPLREELEEVEEAFKKEGIILPLALEKLLELPVEEIKNLKGGVRCV